MLSAARCVVHSLGKLSATNTNISTNTNTNTHYFLSFLFIFTIASFLVLFFYCLPFGLLAFLYLLWIPTSFEVLFTFLELVYSFINPPRLAYTLLCIFFFFHFCFVFFIVPLFLHLCIFTFLAFWILCTVSVIVIHTQKSIINQSQIVNIIQHNQIPGSKHSKSESLPTRVIEEFVTSSWSQSILHPLEIYHKWTNYNLQLKLSHRLAAAP